MAVLVAPLLDPVGISVSVELPTFAEEGVPLMVSVVPPLLVATLAQLGSPVVTHVNESRGSVEVAVIFVLYADPAVAVGKVPLAGERVTVAEFTLNVNADELVAPLFEPFPINEILTLPVAFGVPLTVKLRVLLPVPEVVVATVAHDGLPLTDQV